MSAGQPLLPWVWGAAALALTLLLALYFLSGRGIGHRFVLVLGVLIYAVVPFFAFSTGLYDGGPGQAVWERSFEGLYMHGALALGVLLLLVMAYMAGDLLPRPHRFIAFDRPLALAPLTAALAGLSILCAYYIFQSRELLLSGYLLDYRPDLMGPLATASLATLLFLLNLCQWRQSQTLLRAYAGLLLLNSAALLSMGGRLYVAATVVGMALFWFDRPALRAPKARLVGLLLAMLAVLLLGLVGLLRVDLEIDLVTAGQLLLAEPLLTSISLGGLADCRLVDWINVPTNYGSSIINFIPSALLPDKERWLVDLDPGGNCLASPFGATHIGTALLVNFGVGGAMLMVAAFAYLMKWLRRDGGWWLYYYLCSLLPFMLFRDGFLIFNKAFFGTGLLLALIMVMLSPRRPREARLPDGGGPVVVAPH